MVSQTWVSLSPPSIKGLSAFQVQLILQLLLACSKQTSVHFFSGAESWFVARRLISHVSAHGAAWNPRSGWSSVVVACMRHLCCHPFFAYGFRCIQLLHRCSVACVCKKKLPSINKCLWKIPAVFAKQVPGVFLQPS